MENWIDELARALDEEPLDVRGDGAPARCGARCRTPGRAQDGSGVHVCVVGCAVGRQLASGEAGTETLSTVLNRLKATLPAEAPEG